MVKWRQMFEIETTFEGSNIIIFNDEVGGFTGNGYMIANDESVPANDFGVINYPIKAVEADTFYFWMRATSIESSIFL